MSLALSPCSLIEFSEEPAALVITARSFVGRNRQHTNVYRFNLTLEAPCIIFAIYIQSSEIRNVVALITFIVMWMYLGVKCRSLQVLLYNIAAMHLNCFILMFSYIYMCVLSLPVGHLLT